MRPVGNDVVDLEDPAIASTHLRERFVARVCCESERALVVGAADPKLMLWSLFAAKEAAFKALSKSGPFVFAHRRFVVSADSRSVTYEKQVLWLRVDVEGPCVHAVAWTDDETPIFGVEQIAPGADASAAARALRSIGTASADRTLEEAASSAPGAVKKIAKAALAEPAPARRRKEKE